MSEKSARMPLAIKADEAPLRTKRSNYPEPFASRMANREKRPLGDLFGLKNFGVNLTTLLPGGESALMHRHSRQDEFIYILSGTVTLATDDGEIELHPGMCAGFPAEGRAHHLINTSSTPAVFLEIGDRTPNDQAFYPVDDLKAELDDKGTWQFTRKNGQPV